MNQWLNPRKTRTGSKSGGSGPGSSACPPSLMRLVTPSAMDLVAKEATRKACGVLVAMLPGHSWTPILSSGSR